VQAAAGGLLPGRVTLLGPVHGDDRYNLIRRAVALVLPSESEMQSLSALEAIALGTPVVASRGASAGLGSGPHLVVYNTGDIEDLTRAIHGIKSLKATTSSPPAMKPWCTDTLEMAGKLVDVYRNCIAGLIGQSR
jgi:glycosyltransferase involved in cell wall biosynthesis